MSRTSCWTRTFTNISWSGRRCLVSPPLKRSRLQIYGNFGCEKVKDTGGRGRQEEVRLNDEVEVGGGVWWGGGAEPRTIAIGSPCQTKAGSVIYLPTAGIGPRRSASGLWRREPERAGDENVQTKLAASQTSGPGGRWGSCDKPPQTRSERGRRTQRNRGNPPPRWTGSGFTARKSSSC